MGDGVVALTGAGGSASGSAAAGRRWRSGPLLGTVILALGMLSAPSASAASGGAAAPAPTHGPVGWDTYRQLDGLGQLRSGEQTKEFSSSDRTGGNNDGFNGTYSCLRQSAEGCVIAEASGAGEISSMWFTRDYGDVTNDGRILVELDGKTVLDAPLQAVVDGTLGAPFVWPLVGNGDDTSGGAVINVPMPYRQSMRVTVQNNPDFYHVTYRKFADATGVSTFDPTDHAQDVIDRLRMFGVADPKPAAPSASTSRSTVDVPSGGSATVADHSGSGEITALRLNLPQAVRSPQVVDDGRAFGPGGSSSFTVAVDPANQGVRLTRRYDPNIGDQHAAVLVDGKPAGTWQSGPSTGPGQWQDQTIDLPPALTAGKSTLRITNVFQFTSGQQVLANTPRPGPPKPQAPQEQLNRAAAIRAAQLQSVLSGFSEFRYDVHSLRDGDWNRTDVLDLGPDHPGEQQAHNYTITGQTWMGTETGRYPVDPRALAASDSLLADARLRITFDGRSTVDAPVGEFFGSGLGDYDSRNLMSSIDAAPGGWFTSWWPMPYAHHVTVQLVNAGGAQISGATVEVTTAPDSGTGAKLAAGTVGYFNATHHEGNTQDGRDWEFLDTGGRGVYYGVTQTMRGQIPAGNTRAYLEGDERAFVDGQQSPAWSGTGTEDFFESGWYFRDGTTFAMPLTGNPAYETAGDGCQYDCTGAYRLQFSDAVAFNQGLKFGIEHGPTSNVNADYSSTAYWYGQADPALSTSDLVDPTDAGNRQAHGYQAAGETPATLTSPFEGDDRAGPTSRGVTSAAGPVSFTANVRPGADLRLTRLGDQNSSGQQAQVFVDGQFAGTWLEPLGNQYARWLDDSFDIPGSLTAGRSTVDIRLVPSPAAVPWSASRYRVLALGPPAPDRAAPAAVTGLQAASEQLDGIDLKWQPSDDNVGVAGYQVFASDQPSNVANPGNLVATVVAPGFRHTGLGANRTLFYQVRAVDAAGNVGPLSPVVAGTSGATANVETENLLPPVQATQPAEYQSDCCGITWSNDAQLWFVGARSGDTVTVDLPVVTAGTYGLTAMWTQAPDYGIVQLAVDGQPVGPPFDGYHPATVVITPQDQGTVRLAAGQHRLTLTVVGKNPAALNYLAGLDRLLMTRVGP